MSKPCASLRPPELRQLDTLAGRDARRLIEAATVLLVFAFSLPAATPYIGQLPPNVWHNSTTILAASLALALFWSSYRFLENGRARDAFLRPDMLVLNTLVQAMELRPPSVARSTPSS